jgi:hypothetical protein
MIGHSNVDFNDTSAFLSQDLVNGILETDKWELGELRCVG